MKYKVPFRQAYTETFKDWLKQTFWCHIVIKVFPALIDLESDGLKKRYIGNPEMFYDQHEWLIYKVNGLQKPQVTE